MKLGNLIKRKKTEEEKGKKEFKRRIRLDDLVFEKTSNNVEVIAITEGARTSAGPYFSVLYVQDALAHAEGLDPEIARKIRQIPAERLESYLPAKTEKPVNKAEPYERLGAILATEVISSDPEKAPMYYRGEPGWDAEMFKRTVYELATRPGRFYEERGIEHELEIELTSEDVELIEESGPETNNSYSTQREAMLNKIHF